MLVGARMDRYRLWLRLYHVEVARLGCGRVRLRVRVLAELCWGEVMLLRRVLMRRRVALVRLVTPDGRNRGRPGRSRVEASLTLQVGSLGCPSLLQPAEMTLVAVLRCVRCRCVAVPVLLMRTGRARRRHRQAGDVVHGLKELKR